MELSIFLHKLINQSVQMGSGSIGGDSYYCIHCNNEHVCRRQDFTHKEDCLILEARTQLGRLLCKD